MKTKSTTSPQLQAQTRTVRIVEAALSVKVPSDRDKRFLSSLLNKTSSEMAIFPEGLVVRLYEAAAAVEFASDDVRHFRESCQDLLGRMLNLSAHRTPRTTP